MKNPIITGKLPFAISLMLVGSGAALASVQADDNEKEKVKIEEIIVTATKREKNLQDVPISMAAFSNSQLEQSGIENLRDIQFLAAGMQVRTTDGGSVLTIRGVGSTQFSPGAESGSAVHRDGLYLGQRQDLAMGFFDVERIEVLRGPQGTLYGRNATGGSVNIITKAPTTEFESGGKVTFGNYSLIETEFHASGPLAGENLSGRVAVKTSKNDGYTPDIFQNEGHDNLDFAAIRTKLRYTPATDFQLDLSADYARDDGIVALVRERGRSGTPLLEELAGFPEPNGRFLNQDAKSLTERRLWGLSANAQWELSGVTLASVTGYRKYEQLQFLDLDRSPLSIMTFDNLEIDYSQFSQEFTVSSSGAGSLEWIMGLFYYRADESQSAVFVLPGLDLHLPLVIPELSGDAYAVFGEASYPVFDRLTVTLGARYSYEEKLIDQYVAVPANSEHLEDNWSSFTPKLALTYVFNEDITGYATISRGFKAGTYNGNTLQGVAVDPEEVTNYEIGLKSSLYDGRLQTNVAAFFMDYKDLQALVQGINPITGGPVNLLDNAASSTIKGVEMELQAQPTENISLDSSLAWLDATFDEWPDAFDIGGTGIPTDVSGNQLPDSPKWSANFGATYSVPVGGGTISLRGEYAYKGKTYFTPFELNVLSQDAFGIANARVAFDSENGRLHIAAWIQNITDKLAKNGMGEGSAITGHPLYSNYFPPRTYGVTIGFQY